MAMAICDTIWSFLIRFLGVLPDLPSAKVAPDAPLNMPLESMPELPPLVPVCSPPSAAAAAAAPPPLLPLPRSPLPLLPLPLPPPAPLLPPPPPRPLWAPNPCSR